MYKPLVKRACWGAESDNHDEIEVKNSYGFVLWSCHFVWALNWLAIIKTHRRDKNVHVEFSVYRLVHRQTDKFLIKERRGISLKEKTQSNICLLELLVCINLLGIDLFYLITFSFIRVFITQVASVLLNMTIKNSFK